MGIPCEGMVVDLPGIHFTYAPFEFSQTCFATQHSLSLLTRTITIMHCIYGAHLEFVSFTIDLIAYGG